MNLNLQNNKMKGMNATMLHNIPELLHSSLSYSMATKWDSFSKKDRSMSPSSTASANT